MSKTLCKKKVRNYIHFANNFIENESCHDTNFVDTGTSDDKVGIMTTLGYQCFNKKSQRGWYPEQVLLNDK